MKTATERFWGKVEKTATCWIWTGARSDFGHGIAWFEGSLHRAHRVSFLLEYGHWPEPQGLHRCDVPECVNPKHIFEGTAQDNIDDAIKKGRLKSGDHQKAKTHCPKGHDYSKTRQSAYYERVGWRRCAECHRIKEAARNRKW